MGEHDALMGGEESGGFGVSAHLRNKDGVLVALLAAAAAAEKPLDDRVDALLAEHGEIHQGRVSVDCRTTGKPVCWKNSKPTSRETVAGEGVADVSTVDGFKMTLADGTWVLVRPPARSRSSGCTPKPGAKRASTNCSTRAATSSSRWSDFKAQRTVDQVWTPTSSSRTRVDSTTRT